MEFCSDNFRVLFFFLSQYSLVIISNKKLNFSNIEISVTLAINKIKKSFNRPEIADILDRNIQKRKDSSRHNMSKIDISKQGISVILKKVLIEVEGPLGNIIFSKSKREFGCKDDDLDKKSTIDFIEVISRSVSTSKRDKFKTDAVKISNEYFS